MMQGFNFIPERLLATDLHGCTEPNNTQRLDSTQDQHGEKKQTLLVLLAQSQPLPLQSSLDAEQK